MKLLVISDIHANLTALEAVLGDAQRIGVDSIAVLGDIIDYGMRPNECIETLCALELPVICCLWGNHERAIMLQDWLRFSTERGSSSAKSTLSKLSGESMAWLDSLDGKTGVQEFKWAGLSLLGVHGCFADPFWKAIDCDEALDPVYMPFDVVLSGHNHIPHVFDVFYYVDKPETRNRKRTMFINPGSVGQPRDNDPRAHYAILDTDRGVTLGTVAYDVHCEEVLFDGSVDDFYRDRLRHGV